MDVRSVKWTIFFNSTHIIEDEHFGAQWIDVQLSKVTLKVYMMIITQSFKILIPKIVLIVIGVIVN